jgi:hypothetical protein
MTFGCFFFFLALLWRNTNYNNKKGRPKKNAPRGLGKVFTIKGSPKKKKKNPGFFFFKNKKKKKKNSGNG